MFLLESLESSINEQRVSMNESSQNDQFHYLKKKKRKIKKKLYFFSVTGIAHFLLTWYD